MSRSSALFGFASHAHFAFTPPVLHAHSEACDRLGRRCVVGRLPVDRELRLVWLLP